MPRRPDPNRSLVVVDDRRAIAPSALGVLAAGPLCLLSDIGVVGRLGALPLAGLAIGRQIVGVVGSKLKFLSRARPRARPALSGPFMRNASLISALVGFLPLIWLSLVSGWGLWSASGRG